jgi:hypothetical protein
MVVGVGDSGLGAVVVVVSDTNVVVVVGVDGTVCGMVVVVVSRQWSSFTPP